MIIEAIAAGYLIADYIYHRLAEPDGVKPEQRRLHIPRVDNGAPIGLIYGRTRVREPIPSWVGTPAYAADALNPGDTYQINLFLTLGIPMEGGTNRVHSMWLGDEKMTWGQLGGSFPSSYVQTGDGEFEDAIQLESGDLGGYVAHGTMETLNGKSTQTLIDDDGTARTTIGAALHASGLLADHIPGYRGVMTAYLKGDSSAPAGFAIGQNSNIPAVSLEVSSYRNALINSARIGDDMNPAVVLYDLVTTYLAKGGIAASYIHTASWSMAASTLYGERHGYSNCISTARSLADHILDILRQIDAVIYEAPSDGKLHFKLVRPDYNVSLLPEINKSNCIDLVNFVMGGQQGRTNRVRVLYPSRLHDYNERDEVAFNMANAAGQSGIVNESVLSFAGVNDAALAYKIAQRELAWSCRPLVKCRAIVDRTWYNITPGTAVRVKWTDPDVAGLVFRVGRVDRGTLGDGKIALDLILDNSYVPPRFGTVYLPQSGGGSRERHDDLRRPH